MAVRGFQEIWKEQCLASRRVRIEHGVLPAMEYLIGEKLFNYAETAVTRPEFARELPRFVAEVRDIFNSEEIRRYLDQFERMKAVDEQQRSDHDEIDDILVDSPERVAAKQERFLLLKDLLTSPSLGTG